MPDPRTPTLSSENSPEAGQTYDELVQAIVELRPLKDVTRLYAAYAFARKRNKVHVSQHLGVDRRTLQRWKVDEIVSLKRPMRLPMP